MGARHFNYEDDWENEILECPKCHWKGTFKEAGPNYFAEVMDCQCPNCDFFEAPMLAIVNYSLGDCKDQRPRILKEQEPPTETRKIKTPNPALQNLLPHDGDYRYRSAAAGELVEFRVYYDRGGRNDRSREEAVPEGIWIIVIPMEIQQGVVCVKFHKGPVLSGLRFFVIEAREDDRKKLDLVAARCDQIAPEVARFWKPDHDRAVQMVVAAIGDIARGEGGPTESFEGRSPDSETALTASGISGDVANGTQSSMVLSWNAVRGAAEAAFEVWESGGELQWAEEVWKRTVATGLANYSNELERHRVAILFLGLAGLYRDFCALAWDERDAPAYSDWAEELYLNDFVLGQIAGPNARAEKYDALNRLVNTARPQVMDLLTQLFGNINRLFCAMWRAGPDSANERDDDCEGGEMLTDDQILNDPTPEKVAAYSWLRDGADVLLNPS
jgi:hypothetical protein